MSGMHLGGYGWVENLQAAPTPLDVVYGSQAAPDSPIERDVLAHISGQLVHVTDADWPVDFPPTRSRSTTRGRRRAGCTT